MSTRAKAKKDQIITRFIEARKELLKAAAMIPTEAQDEVFLGIWSVKDLVAHLVGWDYTNLEAAQEILDGKLPTVLSRYDPDWQTFNAGLVAQHRRSNWSELLSIMDQSQQKLIGFLKRLSPEELDRDRGLRSGRYRVTIAWLLKFEIYDEQRHHRQIVRFLEQRAKKQASSARRSKKSST
jgi:uncharacterized damage-inducible protein DinB